jgi:hypothetical protein
LSSAKNDVGKLTKDKTAVYATTPSTYAKPNIKKAQYATYMREYYAYMLTLYSIHIIIYYNI